MLEAAANKPRSDRPAVQVRREAWLSMRTLFHGDANFSGQGILPRPASPITVAG
jgi:hypothetical protein